MKNKVFEQLVAGTANAPEKINWPGTTVEIGLRVLNEQDYLDAQVATDSFFRDQNIKVDMQNVSDYEHEKTTQLLWRAVIDPESGERVFPRISDFRKTLTDQVRTVIAEKQNAYQQFCSPAPQTVSDEDFDLLVASIKKNPDQVVSSVTNIYTLRRLIVFLASPPADSPPGNGSI